MNHDLIQKLKALNPTEGEWIIDDNYNLVIDNKVVASTTGTTHDDDTLITLAPLMREELLKVEVEMQQKDALLRTLSSLNEDHENYRSIAGLITKSRELLRG